MTLNELRTFAKTCNVRYEEHPIVKKYWSEFSIEEQEMVVGYEIGLNNISGKKGKTEWQWVWFETWEDKVDGDTDMYFKHRYSMVNGSVNRGWREEFAAEETIARRMKKN